MILFIDHNTGNKCLFSTVEKANHFKHEWLKTLLAEFNDEFLIKEDDDYSFEHVEVDPNIKKWIEKDIYSC